MTSRCKAGYLLDQLAIATGIDRLRCVSVAGVQMFAPLARNCWLAAGFSKNAFLSAREIARDSHWKLLLK